MLSNDLNLSDNVKNLYDDKCLEVMATIKTLQNDPLTKKFTIKQSDFTNGTLRIKESGIYTFQENIEFSPNSDIFTSTKCSDLQNVLDNFHPKYPEQENDYPKPPYQFGFFAAITIECDNVILDLNGKTLGQSRLHYFHQRFYSNIELNESPFVRGQGPSDFGDIQFPKNIMIKNGTIARSSHHGIHGNGNKNVIIENVTIKDYEVGGIALNGSENVIIRNVEIKDSLKDVDINFLYSNALYTRRFLYELYLHNPNASLNVNGKVEKNIEKLICELQMEMIDHVYLPIKNGTLPTSELFKNPSRLPEGNIYGIVLNGLGVVVNDFAKSYENIVGNKNIVIHDVLMENLTSFPREIITMTDAKKLHVGSVGNIMPYLDITDKLTGAYNPNPMTNATVALAKHVNTDETFTIASKSLNIPQYMIDEWFETETPLENVKAANNLKYVNLRDQMNHFMKGNLTLFISAANGIKVNNIILNKLGNDGLECDCDENRKKDYKEIYETPGFINYDVTIENYVGGDIVPVLIASSNNVSLNNMYCSEVSTLNGKCQGVKLVGNSKNIDIRNINVNEVDYDKNINKLSGYNYGVYNAYVNTENLLLKFRDADGMTNMDLTNFKMINRNSLSNLIRNSNRISKSNLDKKNKLE